MNTASNGSGNGAGASPAAASPAAAPASAASPAGAPLAGRVALVTGASRGIGRAIALRLAAEGATVIGTATGEAGVKAIEAAAIEADAVGGPATVRGRLFGRALDVTDAAAAQACVDAVVAEHGTLSILVNNAGITRDTLAMRMKDEDWASVLDTNLSAVFRMSRLAIRPMMKARHGRIISITSVVAHSGNAGQANYAAAKAGVAGMTRSLAREIASRGITVNCVAPGFIDTDMTRALDAQQVAELTRQIPAGRFGQPEDVAAAVAFLACEGAGYVTGMTLPVNGGMYMG